MVPVLAMAGIEEDLEVAPLIRYLTNSKIRGWMSYLILVKFLKSKGKMNLISNWLYIQRAETISYQNLIKIHLKEVEVV